MSTIVGHALTGPAISLLIPPKEKSKNRRELIFQTGYLIFISLVPDLDVAYGLAQGETIFSMHRQMTHTIPFALVAGLITYVTVKYLLRKKGKEAWRWSAMTVITLLVHLLMDYVIQPLYLTPDIHIYSGEERSVLGVFLPLISPSGITAISREILIVTPLFLIAFLKRWHRRERKF